MMDILLVLLWVICVFSFVGGVYYRLRSARARLLSGKEKHAKAADGRSPVDQQANLPESEPGAAEGEAGKGRKRPRAFVKYPDAVFAEAIDIVANSEDVGSLRRYEIKHRFTKPPLKSSVSLSDYIWTSMHAGSSALGTLSDPDFLKTYGFVASGDFGDTPKIVIVSGPLHIEAESKRRKTDSDDDMTAVVTALDTLRPASS